MNHGISHSNNQTQGKFKTSQPLIDVSLVDGWVKQIGGKSENLIPLLQAIQKHWNYLPKVALERLSEITEIEPDAITGVSTFYSQFRHHPVGKNIIKTCVGTACHVSGANIIDETFRNELDVPVNSNTDPPMNLRSRKLPA
jgi:NADH-quinone oxidoreductase subunit F